MTNHMAGSKHLFSKLDMNINDMVKFGKGSATRIEGHGNILLQCKNGEHRTLAGVYFIPRLKASIVSVGQLDEMGCRVEIAGGLLNIFDQSHRLLAKVLKAASRLYYLPIQVAHSICLAAKSEEATWKWHSRFGHLNFNSLRKLANQNMVRCLPPLNQVNKVCDGCLVSKQRRASFPVQAKRLAEHVLDLVHGDLCGPIAPATIRGNRYFLLLVDDMSRYMWLRLPSRKDQAPTKIKNFQAAVEVETGRKLKVLRTNHGGEFTSVEFGEYCASRGVGC